MDLGRARHVISSQREELQLLPLCLSQEGPGVGSFLPLIQALVLPKCLGLSEPPGEPSVAALSFHPCPAFTWPLPHSSAWSSTTPAVEARR